jgi:hypothetical protein
MSRGHVPVLRILGLEGETRGSTISAATATVTSLTFAVYAGRCDCLFAPSASSRSERQRRRPQVRRPSRRPDRARGTGSLGRAVRSAADTVRDSERPGVGRTRAATRATSCESSGHVRGRSTGRHRSVRRTCTGTSRSRSTAVGPRFVRSRPRRGAADPRADSVSDRTAFARLSTELVVRWPFLWRLLRGPLRRMFDQLVQAGAYAARPITLLRSTWRSTSWPARRRASSTSAVARESRRPPSRGAGRLPR